MLITSLAIAAVLHSGAIWVRTSPGLFVSVDAKERGVTTQEESGLLITDVSPGTHVVTVRLPNGGSTDVIVDVRSGHTVTATVSPLAFHARASRTGGIEIRLTGGGPACLAHIGDREQSFSENRVLFNDLAPSTYVVRIACGSTLVQGSATVEASRIVVLDADTVKRTIKNAGDRPKSTRLFVSTSSDVLASTNLPADFKRAFLNAIPPGARLLSISKEKRSLEARFSAATPNIAAEIAYRLRVKLKFYKIEVETMTIEGDTTFVDIALTPRGNDP